MRRAIQTLAVGIAHALWGVSSALAAEGGMPQLDVSTYPGQIFWMGLTFAFLYLFFSFWVLPRLSAIVDGRAARVAADLAEASRLTALAEETRQAYEQALGAAHREAADLLIETERSLRAQSLQAMSEMQQRIGQDLAVAERRIAKAAQESRDEVERLIAESVVFSAEMLADVRVDQAKAQSAIESLSGKTKAA